MLKIAIVGCGKVADQHVQAIRRIPDCEIVALCDRELLMAKQLGERSAFQHVFPMSGNVGEARPDVVHITTPPQSHFSLAKQCLESGSHVYLEKPFTITANEAESLIRLAESCDLKITAGHNYHFTLEMLEMRRLIAGGISRRKTDSPGELLVIRSGRYNLCGACSGTATIGFASYRDNYFTTSSATELPSWLNFSMTS